MAGEAMDVCLRVLRKATKVGSTAYSVSHITCICWDCHVYIFSDLSRNSCIS